MALVNKMIRKGKYELKQIILDGETTWKLKCPGCGIWAYIDDDQYNGRVSILCDCGFHETIDFKKY